MPGGRHYKIVTEEHTVERQEQLMKAATAGKKFSVMGGNHTTSDDVFISIEMTLREKDKQRLTTMKRNYERQSLIEQKAKSVIATKGADAKGWLKTDLDAVLGWYGVKKLSSMGKEEKVQKWGQLQRDNVQPNATQQWTDNLEQQLITARSKDIAIGDTAVGRYEKKRQEDFKREAPKFTNEQWAQMTAEREGNSPATTPDDNSNIDNAGNN
jgi:hypothetical protein